MSKRILSLVIVLTFGFISITGRIGYIIFSKDYIAADTYNSYVLTLSNKAPNLLYCDYSKATNNKISYVAVIRPNPKCVGELNRIFTYSECNKIIEELKQGLPVIREINKKHNCKYIRCFKIYQSNNTLNQLVNKSSNGVLAHINDDNSLKIKYSVSANGRLLDGDNGTVLNNNYYSSDAYRLSINKRIQEVVINSTKYMFQGCVVVMDVIDSSILAIVNKPNDNYSIKAFSSYSVGSVFKIVVALCALENGVDINFMCNGSITVGDTTFNCQNNKIHGNQNLKNALANSCNCYFVSLANTLGCEKLMLTCDKLGFNNKTNLINDWNIKNAYIPSKEQLNKKGELSLFGFGQGKLLATPLQMCSVLCTIGNDGKYQSPKLFLSKIQNGKESYFNYDKPKRVVSKQDCQTLINNLSYVVSYGTGRNAQTLDGKAAGKTATAQTGQFSNGREKLNTWFAGLYPYDNPKYAIVILCEDGISGSQNCCPIFRTIVEQIKNL